MRRIAVIDVETTGLESDAEVIETGITLVDESEGGNWLLKHRSISALYGTTKTLTPAVRAIHHITQRDVQDLPTFAEEQSRYRPGPQEFPLSAIAFHNADYDLPLMLLAGYKPPAPVICTRKCAIRAFPDAPSWSNQVLRYWLQDQGFWPSNFMRKLAQPAHRAAPDSYVTAYLLITLLGRHSLDQLIQWSAEPRYMPTCPIGEFKGKPWADVRADFLDWMIHKAKDLDRDTRAAASAEKERRLKEREAQL